MKRIIKLSLTLLLCFLFLFPRTYSEKVSMDGTDITL